MAPKTRPVLAVLLAAIMSVSISVVGAFTGPFVGLPPQSTQQYSTSFLSMSTTPPSKQQKRRWWTRLRAGPSSIDKESKPRVLVKERPRVYIDRDTGKLTEVSRPSQNQDSQISPWNLVKQTFYNTADAVSKVGRKEDKTRAKPVDGYSSTIERVVLDKPSLKSPGQRLMKEYQDRSLETSKESTKPRSLFDGVKEGFYSTVDSVANVVQPESNKKPPSPVKTSNTYKPVVQPTLASSPEVKDALPDLKSSSPGKRWLAELKIRNWEETQRRRKRDLKRQQAADSFKEAVYNLGDAVVFSFKSLTKLPDRLTKAADDLQAAAVATKGAVETTVETVQQIPTQVNQTVANVQSTVETSIETTKKTVEDVQALPTKIEAKVKDTKKSVDDTITNVKILVGAEKKRPVPPETPPPPPLTAQDIALKVAGGAATIVAKTAWWVAGGVAKAGFEGAKLAAEKVTEKIEEQQQGMTSATAKVQKTQMSASATTDAKTSTATATVTAPEKASKKETVEDDWFDQEVSDALAFAEEAVKMADEGKEERKSDLDAALKRARETAVLASQQAKEKENKKSSD